MAHARHPETVTRGGSVMLRIGEFSWLSQVTVRTLRYYDEIGLLSPARVDSSTDYRYYTLEQLPRLHRILALKDLGLSLEQVRQVLDADLPPEELRGMLRLKRAELADQMQEVQARLQRVEARLRLIEMEGKMPEYEVLLKTVEAQQIASIREVYSTDMQDVFGPALTDRFDELERYLVRHGADYAGPGIAIWHGSYSGFDNAAMDVEAAAPIAQQVPGSDRVKVRELPGGQVAYVVHQGRYTALGEARRAVLAWMDQNGFRLRGPVREVYLHHDADREANMDSPRHVTEVQCPVEEA
jgi:DNA-binding transcriptional MerR regulator